MKGGRGLDGVEGREEARMPGVAAAEREKSPEAEGRRAGVWFCVSMLLLLVTDTPAA